jgi:hypothetical protein
MFRQLRRASCQLAGADGLKHWPHFAASGTQPGGDSFFERVFYMVTREWQIGRHHPWTIATDNRNQCVRDAVDQTQPMLPRAIRFHPSKKARICVVE